MLDTINSKSIFTPPFRFHLYLQEPNSYIFNIFSKGKTHTMLGSAEEPGVIPRAVCEVFKLVHSKQEEEEWHYSIGMSYLEIYNEKVKAVDDLLIIIFFLIYLCC